MDMISHEFIFNEKLSFEERCNRVFRYQAKNNSVLKTFFEVYGLSSESELNPAEIPLLPIRAFKEKSLLCGGLKPKLVFKSSGTSGMERSTHPIANPDIYKTSIKTEFYRHFPPDYYALACYMPGYRDNPDSSLIWMAKHLIDDNTDGLNTFLPEEPNEFEAWKERAEKKGKKILLFGAAFGLMDLAEDQRYHFPENTDILETGGMKTYRREMTKSELRCSLSEGFGIKSEKIHSEYGMCELLSQMYALSGKWFTSPHWVHVSVRHADQPAKLCSPGEEGKIGIIDLANLHSCSFILTEDRGVMNQSGEFKVLGRWHPENRRGCNFLIDQEM